MNLQNSSAASKRFPEVLLLGWWIDKFFFPKTILWYPRIPGSISSIPENLFHSSRASWSAKETSNYLLDQRHRFNYLKHPKESPILFSCLRALQKWQNKRKVQNHSTNAWKSTSKTSKIGKKKTGPFLKITSSWFHFIKKINRAWPPRSGQQKKIESKRRCQTGATSVKFRQKIQKRKEKEVPFMSSLIGSVRSFRFESVHRAANENWDPHPPLLLDFKFIYSSSLCINETFLLKRQILCCLLLCCWNFGVMK